MPQLLRLASFLLFLALGARVRGTQEPAARRRATNFLLAYVILTCGAAGVIQEDSWPFTNHQIAVGRPRSDSRICQTQFYGLDALGNEWRLDPWSWTPVYDSILQFWVEQNLGRLPPAGRERVLRFLLDRAERSRGRLAASRPLGPERLLGRAGAPYWLLLPRVVKAPAEPYTGLRLYHTCWFPAELVTNPERVLRTLTVEVGRP